MQEEVACAGPVFVYRAGGRTGLCVLNEQKAADFNVVLGPRVMLENVTTDRRLLVLHHDGR